MALKKENLKCPYCGEKSKDHGSHSKHVTLHVVEGIRKSYPGLMEMISKVEQEIPVKFMLKVDIEALEVAQGIGNGVIDNLDKEEESSDGNG